MHAINGLGRIAMRQSTQKVRCIAFQRVLNPIRAVIEKPKAAVEEAIDFPRKVFSGIQPTGSLHLGNYLGAVKKWGELQNEGEHVTYCIVDMHSITVAQDPAVLRENIIKMAATMLACGINPEKSIVFVQSSVKEHAELGWILSCITTMARLGHLPQYKEKTRLVKDVPLGIFVYPVLQAADIMLHKTTHVPVGEDQIQHIQLAQHLTKTFNSRFGPTFPICQAMIEDNSAARIRSLRDPTKKMSKSDPDPKATINIMDEPEAIVEKIKKAMTDFISDVNFDPARRSGVSNLIAIHSLVTNTPVETIVEEAKTIDTGKYKLRVADAVVAHLAPIRLNVQKQLENPRDLMHILDVGAKRARVQAQHTMAEVFQKIGLGTQNLLLLPESKDSKIHTKNIGIRARITSIPQRPNRPEVPKQKQRVEKEQKAKYEMVIEAAKPDLLTTDDKILLPTPKDKEKDKDKSKTGTAETAITATQTTDKSTDQSSSAKSKNETDDNGIGKKAKDLA